MKKLILLVTIVAALILVGFGYNNYVNAKKETLPESESMQVGNYKMEVNPGIELLTVVQYLSNYTKMGYMANQDFKYREEVEDYFRKYESNPAVLYYNEIYRYDFKTELPVKAMLLMNSNFTRKADYKKEFSEFKERSEKLDLDKFYQLLKEFYLETDFQSFFDAHREFYKKEIELNSQLIPSDLIENIEERFDKKQKSYTIILAPLYSGVGYGYASRDKDGLNCYSILSVTKNIGENKQYFSFGDDDTFVSFLTHEWLHSFVELEAEEVKTYIEKSEPLFKEINGTMSKQNYPVWETALEEMFVRAITIDVMSNYFPKNTDWELYNQTHNGFIYVKDIYQMLQEYKKNPQNYDSYQEYIPYMIEKLIKLYS